MSSILVKPRPATVTLKLDATYRDRLKSLAATKKRTPHYLMKEAIRSPQRPSTINVEAISVATSIGSTRTACGASASCAST